MKKVKIFEFENGKQAFSTGNIGIEINGQKASKIYDIEQPDEIVDKFFEKPKSFKVDLKKKKIKKVI